LSDKLDKGNVKVRAYAGNQDIQLIVFNGERIVIK
jgi:hypothetical protein